MRNMWLLLLFYSFSVFSCVTTASVSGDAELKMIANVDPVRTAKIGVRMNKVFTKDLAESELYIAFHPRTNEASLNFTYQGNRHILLFSESSREVLRKAALSYTSDFDNRKLNVSLKMKKTRAIYGTISGRLEWGLFSLNGKGKPDVYLGYIFNTPRVPYFTLYLPQTANFNGQNDDDNINDKSIETTLYFNKGQALALSDALKQDSLLASLDPIDLQKKNYDVDEYSVK